MLKKNWPLGCRRSLLICCLTSLFSIIAVATDVSMLFAQGDCEDAGRRFSLGRFEEALESAESCLNDRNLTDDQKIRVHELQGLTYIATDHPDSAWLPMRDIFRLDQDYEARPEEHPLLFLDMADQLRSEVLKVRRRKRFLLIGGVGIASTGALAAIILKGKKAPRLPDPPAFPTDP